MSDQVSSALGVALRSEPSARGWVRWLVAAVAGLVAICAMGARPAPHYGFWLGLFACLVSAGSWCWSLPQPRPRPDELRSVSLGSVVREGGLVLVLGVLGIALLRLAVRGALPVSGVGWGVLITVCFVGGLLASTRLLREFRRGDSSLPPSVYAHHGLWLGVLTAGLYLPGLGVFGLIDPWETHYGEVAREIVERRDWISLWWARDGWFWSKPILTFWAMAGSFLLLGVPTGADQMLAGVALGHSPAPEWALRLPGFLFALLGQYVLYCGVRAHLGRRIAFFGGVVLCTSPYWYGLAHQGMVDIFYVAPVAAALGCGLLALRAGGSSRAATYQLEWQGRRVLWCSGFHLLMGVVLLLALPQIYYLISRNLAFHWAGNPFGFLPHLDQVMQGSPGNCHLPGNRACSEYTPATRASFQPVFAASVWALCLLVLIFRERRELRLSRLYYLGFAVCTALSFMAKGAPGLVLAVVPLLAFVVGRGRWAELLRMRPLSILLILAVVAAPWFVQMYVRHGSGFFERLFMHDMVKRAFDHVHDTNRGDDTSFRYYVWQLGYGFFPWSGLVAAGGLYCLGHGLRASRPGLRPNADPLRDVIDYLMLYVLVAFGMFSISNTKFHHYIFPLVPASAMLAGVLLDRLAPEEPKASARALVLRFGLAITSAACAALAVVCFMTGGLMGQVEAAPRPWIGLLLAITSLAFGWLLYRVLRPSVPERTAPVHSAMLGQLALGACVITALVGRDLSLTVPGDMAGALRIFHLFIYNYSRPWPESVEYGPVFAGLTLTACGAGLLLLWPSLRRLGVWLSASVACLACGWVLSVYFVQLANHFGQRAVVEAYYRGRAGPEEPFVAFQLNWKGENFYTGNHMADFMTTGKKFERWLKDERAKGTRVLYVATEHSRISGLKRELKQYQDLQVLVDKRVSNKFVIARVVL